MGLAEQIKVGDWRSVRSAIAKLNTKLGPTAEPTFAGLTLTAPLTVPYGGTGLATLTDHGLLLGSGTGAITPLAEATDGQIPIGDTDGDPILATITGTANQVNVANAAGSITLSTPQDIHTGASPTFVYGKFGPLGVWLYDPVAEKYLKMVASIGSLGASDRVLEINVNNASRSLTFTGNPTLANWFDQSVKVAASPTFAGLTVDTDTLVVDAVNHRVGIEVAAPTATLDINGTFSITGTGHFGGSLDTDANLTVDGYAAIGTTPNSLYGLYVRSFGSARTRGIYGYVFYSGTGMESYGVYARGFNNVVPAGSYSDNYGGRFESSMYKNTIAAEKTLRCYGGYFRAQDYNGKTYSGDGTYEFTAAYMLVENASGDWATNNPNVTTYELKIGSIPTGYGSNHTHYSIYSVSGDNYFGGIINTGEQYKVDGIQVVSNRIIDARCDDAINSGDAITDGVIDALRDAMIAHGLIAAA